jgi:hypothetical protein
MGTPNIPEGGELLEGPVDEILDTPEKMQSFIDALTGSLEGSCTTQHGVGIERRPLKRNELEGDVFMNVHRLKRQSEKGLVYGLCFSLAPAYGLVEGEIKDTVHSLLLERLDVGPIEKMPAVGDKEEFADALSYELADPHADPMAVRAAVMTAMESSSNGSVDDFAAAVSAELPRITTSSVAAKVKDLLPGLAYEDTVGLMDQDRF